MGLCNNYQEGGGWAEKLEGGGHNVKLLPRWGGGGGGSK